LISEYIGKKIPLAFGVTGGAVVNLLNHVKMIPMHHEQAAAMAADAYAKLKGVGYCIGTSGPGVTNLLTGICCSWFDSVPVVAIGGQVPTNQLKTTERQKGFQEIDNVSIMKPVTKHSFQLTDKEDFDYAVELAKADRKGPVYLEICDDIQRK